MEADIYCVNFDPGAGVIKTGLSLDGNNCDLARLLAENLACFVVVNRECCIMIV
jgi:hypothetical protein